MPKYKVLLLFVLFPFVLFSQKRISGYVTDFETGRPVVGIKISVSNTTSAAVTDNTGKYTLFVPDTMHVIRFVLSDSAEVVRMVVAGNHYNFSVKRYTGDLFNLTLEDLLDISVVTASKRKQSIKLAPTAIDVLSDADLAAISPNRLQDAMEFVTGVSSVNGEGNFFTSTTIRGNTRVNYNTNTTLMYDGIQIYNPYNGSFDFQIIPLSSIKRVEIVKGSESVLYGSNAINGAINVIPRDYVPAKDRMPATDFGARFNYGSYTTSGSNFYLNSRNGDFAFNIYGDLYTKKGEKLTFVDENADTLTFNKGYLGYNFAFDLLYKDLKVGFVAYRRREPDVRTRGFSRIYLFPGDTVGTPVPEYNDEGMMVAYLTYKKKLGKTMMLNLKTSGERWQNYKTLPDAYWYYYSFGSFNTLELSQGDPKTADNIIGVSFNHYIGRRYKSDIGDYDIGKDNLYTSDIALYYSGDYNKLDFMDFSYGVRYFYSKYGQHTYTDISPRIATVVSLNDRLALKLIYGQSFRVPTYFEKEVASETVIGNPDLKAEKSSSFDIVISGVSGNLQMNFDAYYFLIKNQIERVVYPLDTNKRINQNVGIRLYKGIEWTTHYKFPRFQGSAGYSYVIGTDYLTKEPLKYTYNHMFSYVGSFDITEFMFFDVAAKYLSQWGDAPSYLWLNLTLSVKPFIVPLFFSFKVENALGKPVYLPEIARNSPQVPYFPKTMGRSFYLSLHYNFYNR